MQDDFAFLRGILYRPKDELPRLVYADWLEERGDPRAIFLRWQVEPSRQESAKLAQPLKAEAASNDARWIQWLTWSSNLPKGERLDIWQVTNGTGAVDVRGPFPTTLSVDGQRVGITWDDFAGSVGQYVVVRSHTRGNKAWTEIVEVLENGLHDAPIADQIQPMLNEFSNSLYYLHFSPSISQYTVVSTPHDDPGLPGYYPDSRNLLCTQPRERLDPPRVNLFRDRIQAGQRPIVLTTSTEEAYCEFVIDGHHKLAAYIEEMVPPAVLSIVRCDSPGVSLEEGLEFFPPRHPGRAHFPTTMR